MFDDPPADLTSVRVIELQFVWNEGMRLGYVWWVFILK